MIEYTNNGGTGTVTVRYSNDHAKLSKGLEYAAKHIWGGESKMVTDVDVDPIDTAEVFFDDLTNQEKLDILNDWIRDQLLERARLQIGEEKHKQADIDTRNDDTIIV